MEKIDKKFIIFNKNREVLVYYNEKYGENYYLPFIDSVDLFDNNEHNQRLINSLDNVELILKTQRETPDSNRVHVKTVTIIKEFYLAYKNFSLNDILMLDEICENIQMKYKFVNINNLLENNYYGNMKFTVDPELIDYCVDKVNKMEKRKKLC